MAIQAAQSALAQKAEDAAAKSDPKVEPGEPPALALAGLQFFIADISRKTILWHELGSQSFSSEVKELQEAPSSEAFRLLATEDRKNILRLIQGAMKDGQAGPFDVGGGPDHRIPGVPIVAHRYELPDGRLLVICFPSIGEEDNPGRIALGLAPILQHFVASSNRVVLLVDNFGYVRFASDGFVKTFQIEDARFILGRNIAHIQNRVGKTIVSLALASLTRRASATGHGKFLLASNDSMDLNYEAMYFRIGGSIGGVLFSAGRPSGDVDFLKVFEVCSSPILVVNAKTRIIMAANKSALKSYHLTQEALDAKPITETLLHPRSYTTLLEAAKSDSEVPVPIPVNLETGQTKKKRIKATLVDTDSKEPKLILETRN
ncbi:MAG: PAS domain-containing protein [Roseibium sp.]